MAQSPCTHVVLMDGTLSSLDAGRQTNIGLIYRLLQTQAGPNLLIHYEAGVQYTGLGSIFNVLTGEGTNDKIRRAYGILSNNYRAGDRIFLIGFSRGAYAARSLAGVIDRIGMIRHEFATYRNIRQAFRHYKRNPKSQAAGNFSNRFCHKATPINAIAAFDTVKALGIRLPWIWRYFDAPHQFHSHSLCRNTQNAYHALALDETRVAYAPVMWDEKKGWQGKTLQQMWFQGIHSDIGGQHSSANADRGVSNIPLVWMLERLAQHGLPLPSNWQQGFSQNPAAPISSAWAGRQKFFLLRAPRVIGQCACEEIHDTVPQTHVSRRKRNT